VATRPTSPRPLRADAQRNRERIIAAANEVFARRGLGGTMDEVAAEAGVGVGTVYRRFPDKDDLIEALFEQKIGEMAGLAERGAEFEDPWEGLQFFLVEAATLHHRNRGMRDLLFGSDQRREWLTRGRGRIRPRVQKLIDRARKQGRLRTDLDPFDVPLILMMLTSVMDYTAEASPDVWRRQLTIVLDGLEARRDRPTPLPTKPLTGSQLEVAMSNWKST
jgi:AcrR family transcriptional regulator